MGERIRGAVFNKIVDWLPGANVLDTFAGTGALGLEAISRGAKKATFVEKDRVAQKVIAENIATLGVEDKADLIRARVQGWLGTRKSNEKFDIIFVAPPYYDPQFNVVKKLTSLLKKDGVLILDHSTALETPNLPEAELFDTRIYAGAVIAYYRKA
jgi:16S rRNA (guanine966-N2)-methyltransferase